MPAPDAKPPAKQKTKRGWFRRFFRWVGVALLFVVIFHRPLFDYGVRFLVIQIAAHEHLNADLHLSGTIFTNLTVTGVRVSPVGSTPALVKRIEIDRLHLDYSIPSLLRHGIGELLQSYEIVNATLELDVLPSKSEPERQEKNNIAETLNNILGQPAFYSDRVRIQNFNITVRSESSLTVITNFNLLLDPEQPGELRAERIQIPGVPVWTNLHAETSYAARNFFIKRLQLSPDLTLEEFNFDASQRSQNKGSIQLKASAFGGVMSFSLAGSQLNKKGENLAKSYDTVLKLSASDVSIESAAAYFGAPKPPVAKLANLALVFTGEPEKPRTWKGNLAAKVDAIALDKTKIDSAAVEFDVRNGNADLTTANVIAGKNSVSLTARIALPESVNDFPSSDVDASLKISAPDLPGLTAMLPEPATGTISGGGPIRLHGGKVDADLALDVSQLASGKIGIASAKLRVKADKRLAPAPANPLDELTSRVTAELSDLHVQDFAIDSVKLDVENHNALVTLRTLDIHRAGNSVSAHGSYRVPPDLKDAANSPLDAQFAIQAPKLETFGIVANSHPLSGHLDGRGELKTVGGKLDGAIRLSGGDFRLAEFQTGPLSMNVQIANNLATIEEFSLKLPGANQIAVTGKAGIQAPFAYEAGLLADLANLSALQPLLAAFNVKQATGGALHIEWNGKGVAVAAQPAIPAASNQTLAHSGRLGLALTKGKMDNINVSETDLAVTYDAPDLEKPRTWKGNLTANVDAIAIAKTKIDSVAVAFDVQNGNADLTTANVIEGKNSVALTAQIALPESVNDFPKSDVNAQFLIQAPKLEMFGIAANGHTLAGHLDGRGELKMAGKMIEGGIRLNGGDFRLANFQTGPLSVDVRIADNHATIQEFSLKLHGSDQIAITGTAGIQPPFAYDAGLLVEIANLSALQPVLAAFNVKQAVSGALHIDWNGKGDAVAALAAPVAPATPIASAASPAAAQPTLPAPSNQTLAHSGQLALDLKKGKVDKIDLSEIRISGSYGADFAEFKEIRLVLGPTSFTAELALRDGALKLDNMRLQQAGTSVLTGEIAVPIDLKNSNQPIPFDQPISARITAEKLDIEKLLASFGQTAPASGILSSSLTVAGTIQEPSAQLSISGRVLKAKAAAQLDPADFDMDLTYGMKQLSLQANIKQRQIQPLTIRGRAPLDIAAVIKQHAIDPHMPIEASVQLPPTSLAIIPKFTPLVRRIDGAAGIDVRVGGTVEKPALSGSATIDLKDVRMTDENIPALDSFHAKLSFAKDTLAFNTFEGDLGGGKFKLGGNIKLAKLTDPIFDLHLEAKEVLVKRDDSITVRADTDIKFAGPLNAASVGGAIYITHSRFFKEIDILPIALPGKAKPAPRSVQSGPVNVSFPNPPLRDWKFDLAIKTRKDDPFLVRGNLANGKAEIDLHLGGTGLAPTFEGNVHISEFRATLPFSTLKISRGFVYFAKDAPFQPSLDIQADSQIRDYLIHAYIYGKATDPQVTLSAEPPLQYSDIIALLATGSTTSEIGSNADVLASRAAMLAIQQLYRKIFHHGQAAPDEKTTPSLVDRFQIQLGEIDARTGQQEVTSKLKLTDRFYLLGGVGLGGQFMGNLKYLIRFR